MKKYIQVSGNEITAVSTGLFLEGAPTNMFEVPVDTPDMVLINECCWVDGVLHNIGKKPSQFHVVEGSPPSWVFSPEKENQAVSNRKLAMLTQVDAAAGRARLRYITDIPGQTDTYRVKEDQARMWQEAGFMGEPPSFIKAEATATGKASQVIAESVLAAADFWIENKAPEIEATRQKWKLIVSQQTKIDDLVAVMELAETELSSL